MLLFTFAFSFAQDGDVGGETRSRSAPGCPGGSRASSSSKLPTDVAACGELPLGCRGHPSTHVRVSRFQRRAAGVRDFSLGTRSAAPGRCPIQWRCSGGVTTTNKFLRKKSLGPVYNNQREPPRPPLDNDARLRSARITVSRIRSDRLAPSSLAALSIARSSSS